MNKKFIRVLGLGVGLFLAGSLSVNAQKVSFNGERLSLKQAFEKIESVSKYKIAYNTSQLDVNKQVVLNQKNQDVLQILSDLLKGTNCVYQVNNNYIVITLKDDEKVKKIKGWQTSSGMQFEDVKVFIPLALISGDMMVLFWWNPATRQKRVIGKAICVPGSVRNTATVGMGTTIFLSTMNISSDMTLTNLNTQR